MNFTVPKADLPPSWESFDWSRAMMMVWPGSSWVNIRMSVVPLLIASAADAVDGHFQATCQHCGGENKSPSTALIANSRFYFFGVPEFVSVSGEWAIAGPAANPQLVFATGNGGGNVSSTPVGPMDVWIAAFPGPLLKVEGGAASRISIYYAAPPPWLILLGGNFADIAGGGGADNNPYSDPLIGLDHPLIPP